MVFGSSEVVFGREDANHLLHIFNPSSLSSSSSSPSNPAGHVTTYQQIMTTNTMLQLTGYELR
jgi:hypothetical protein